MDINKIKSKALKRKPDTIFESYNPQISGFDFCCGFVEICPRSSEVFLVAQMVKNLLQWRKPGFDSWVRKILWRREWLPTPIFLTGESHGWRRRQAETPGILAFKWEIKFSSVAQSCPTLHSPTNCSTPGLSVHHQLPELAQTHVYRVGDGLLG